MRRLIMATVFLASASVQAQEHPDMAPNAILAATANFDQCLRDLWPAAQARGISRGMFEAALTPVTPDLPIIEKMRFQPEFERPLWSYVDDLVRADRIAKGKQMVAKYKAIWPRMESMFGVDRYNLIALWAVESNFGKSIGDRSVVRSTATLACIGRRQDYFRNELLAAIEILQNGDVPAAHLKGSWAGAFGHTQFMPSTFKPYAVDFDGDGKKNLVDSVQDALASTANNLKKDGWEAGKTWGYEVKLKPGFDLRLIGKDMQIATWEQAGVMRANGKPFPRKDDTAELALPAGAKGPAFLLMKNYELLKRYNGSEAYGYAVAFLADRIRGGAPLIGKWPRHVRMLSANERQELQQRLTAAGFDTGGTEGRVGAKTRSAVRAYQSSRGLPADGFVSADLLADLRSRP